MQMRGSSFREVVYFHKLYVLFQVQGTMTQPFGLRCFINTIQAALIEHFL